MELKRCPTCGADDLMEYADCFQCQRCGSKTDMEGWTLQPLNAKENAERYDDYMEGKRR